MSELTEKQIEHYLSFFFRYYNDVHKTNYSLSSLVQKNNWPEVVKLQSRKADIDIYARSFEKEIRIQHTFAVGDSNTDYKIPNKIKNVLCDGIRSKLRKKEIKASISIQFDCDPKKRNLENFFEEIASFIEVCVQAECYKEFFSSKYQNDEYISCGVNEFTDIGKPFLHSVEIKSSTSLLIDTQLSYGNEARKVEFDCFQKFKMAYQRKIKKVIGDTEKERLSSDILLLINYQASPFDSGRYLEPIKKFMQLNSSVFKEVWVMTKFKPGDGAWKVSWNPKPPERF